MLCRTAEHLFWMARHIERAENTARLLDVTYRMSLLPYRRASRARVGRAVVGAADHLGLATRLLRAPSGSSRAENVLRFMVLDPAQPVVDLLLPARGARESARAVRGAITTEMYEDLNSTWLEMRDVRLRAHPGAAASRDSSTGSSCARTCSAASRSARCCATRRYHFIRLGTLLERADNTARILDVKYHILLPSAADVGGAVDYYQWARCCGRCRASSRTARSTATSSRRGASPSC